MTRTDWLVVVGTLTALIGVWAQWIGYPVLAAMLALPFLVILVLICVSAL